MRFKILTSRALLTLILAVGFGLISQTVAAQYLRQNKVHYKHFDHKILNKAGCGNSISSRDSEMDEGPEALSPTQNRVNHKKKEGKSIEHSFPNRRIDC